VKAGSKPGREAVFGNAIAAPYQGQPAGADS
jgi:hypothetical protein